MRGSKPRSCLKAHDGCHKKHFNPESRFNFQSKFRAHLSNRFRIQSYSALTLCPHSLYSCSAFIFGTHPPHLSSSYSIFLLRYLHSPSSSIYFILCPTHRLRSHLFLFRYSPPLFDKTTMPISEELAREYPSLKRVIEHGDENDDDMSLSYSSARMPRFITFIPLQPGVHSLLTSYPPTLPCPPYLSLLPATPESYFISRNANSVTNNSGAMITDWSSASPYSPAPIWPLSVVIHPLCLRESTASSHITTSQ